MFRATTAHFHIIEQELHITVALYNEQIADDTPKHTY